MSTGNFEIVPVELIEQILLYLSPDDLLAIQLLNKAFNALVSESDELQYSIALQTRGLVDGHALRSKEEKLTELEKRDEAWITLDLSKRTIVRVGHLPSHIYDLSGGVYMLGHAGPDMDMNKTSRLGVFELDNVKEQDGENVKKKMGAREEWRYLTIPDQIIGKGMCLQEYDLIGIVGIRNHPTALDENPASPGHVVLHLRQFSTNKPHPLANQPEIIVSKALHSQQKLSVTVEIVGPCLVLLLTWCRVDGLLEEGTDELLLVNWWTGGVIMRERFLRGVYNSFAFLSPTLLLLPNAREKEVEIIKLPDLSATELQTTTSGYADIFSGMSESMDIKFKRILRLGLPRFRFSDVTIRIRSYPNPFGAVHPKYASGEWRNERERDRMFTADPEKALVQTQLRFSENDILQLITTRDKLVKIVHEHTHVSSPSRSSLWVQTDPDNGDATAATYAPMSPSKLGCDIGDEGFGNCPKVPWRAWGPGVTRLSADGTTYQCTWRAMTAAERFVEMSSFEGRGVIVRDFNPFFVRKAKKALKKLIALARSNVDHGLELMIDSNHDLSLNERTRLRIVLGNAAEIGASVRYLLDENMDWEELPYVEIGKMPDDNNRLKMRGALIDEDRIIGLKYDYDLYKGVVVEFDVFSMFSSQDS